MDNLQQGRKLGYFMTQGENVPDVSAIAVHLSINNESFGLAVAGPSHRVDARFDEIVRDLQRGPEEPARSRHRDGCRLDSGLTNATPVSRPPVVGEAMAMRFSPSDDVRHSVVDDGVYRVTMDRAEKRNPLSLGVLDSIAPYFHRCRE